MEAANKGGSPCSAGHLFLGQHSSRGLRGCRNRRHHLQSDRKYYLSAKFQKISSARSSAVPFVPFNLTRAFFNTLQNLKVDFEINLA